MLFCILIKDLFGIVIGKHNSKKEKKKSSSDSPDESPSFQAQSCVNTKDGAQQAPVLTLHSDKEVKLRGKMKLQLFPLDAHTRQGLEKVKVSELTTWHGLRIHFWWMFFLTLFIFFLKFFARMAFTHI